MIAFIDISHLWETFSIHNGIAIGGENIYFLTPHFKFTRKVKIDESELIKTNEENVDPYQCQVLKCGEGSFKEIDVYKIHSNFPAAENEND